MNQEQPLQNNDDSAPQPEQYKSSDEGCLAQEIAKHPNIEHFDDIPDDLQKSLHENDRFNYLFEQALLPTLHKYINSPESDISEEMFDKKFSGELSPKGYLLDANGEVTFHRPEDILTFTLGINITKQESEALESAYQQFIAEQKSAKETVDETDEPT